MATLSAVVTIQDLPTGTALSGTELLEAVQTVAGVAVSIQVPISQIATTAFGALPVGGATGQLLGKASGTNFATQWVNLSAQLAAGTSLAVSGSTTVTFGVVNFGIGSAQIATNAVGNVQFRQGSPVSVIGVAGSATANVADVTASGGGQILQTNAAGTGIVWGAFSTTLLPGPFKVASFTQNGVVYGNGSSALGVTAAGTAAWPLVGAGPSSPPAFAVLTVPGGGSGTTALSQFGVVFGNGSSALGATSSGTTGFLLTGNGSSSAPSFQAFNIGSSIGTGIIGVPNGGTNTSTLTAHAILLGAGSSTLQFAAPATAGNLLIDQGTSTNPTFRTMSGDAAISSTGAITVTKTNGSSFAPSATIDTTNATNISTGTLGAGRLPTIYTLDVLPKSGRPWIDVRAYGAVGNGVTDDTAAFVSAISAIQALGSGRLYVSNGNYLIASGITLPANVPIDIIGESKGVELQTGSNNVTLITMLGAFSSISNMTLAGFNSTSATNPVVDINLGAVACVLDNVSVTGGTYGIINRSGDTVLTNVNVTQAYTALVNNTFGAMYLKRVKLDQNYPQSTPARSTTFSAWASAHVYTLGTIVSTAGYYIQCTVAGTSGGGAPTVTAYNTNITDNTVTWQLVAPTTYSAILASSGSSDTFAEDCDLTGPFNIGLSILGTAQAVTLRNCVFGQNLNTSITAASGTAGLIVSDCQLGGNIFPSSAGIQLTGSRDTTITSNIIIGQDRCINLSNSATTNTVIVGNQLYSGGTYGIQIDANIGKFSIIGNQCGLSAQWGANGTAINIGAGTGDNYQIIGNNMAGATTGLVDGGTGTNKTVPGQLPATATSDVGNPGFVGEIITTNISNASATLLTTSVAKNIASVSLTPGDWDVDGFVWLQPAATTVISLVTGWVSTSSATLPSFPPEPNGGGFFFLSTQFVTGQNVGLPTGVRRFSLATTASVFLSVQTTFTASTNAAYGFIRGRRMR